MYLNDKAIETEKEDFLNRKEFSQRLGKSLLNWKEEESLVVALNGEWGSGKSSVINLAKEFIKNSDEKDSPTIIEFNPWRFSEQDNLSERFFDEIAKYLEIKKESKHDEKIANELRLYASLLDLAPDKNLFVTVSSRMMLILGFAGISASKLIQYLNVPYIWIQHILFFGGLLFIFVETFHDYLLKIANIFQNIAEFNRKSISEVKEEIKSELIKRQKTLIVIIDDIDRLNLSEMKQIFSLIRVNADFPCTIYLLAFDRNIIEKNLEKQVGISGKDYLDKIVQVNFDIPLANKSKIGDFLFQQLNKILDTLPESAQEFYSQDDPYWPNVYNSGFKDLFKNLRDVKRYASSLEFNISLMYIDKVMEVNPIDFMAIEAIRVFVPDFYSFVKIQKSLFTSTDRSTGSIDTDPRKAEIEKALDKLPKDFKIPIKDLITRLFPQIASVLQNGYSSYGNEWQSSWSKDLRVCATANFDSYFTLIPGGAEEELSQYEIETILSKTNSLDDFEQILREYIKKKKIRRVLEKMQNYTDDESRILQSNVKNVVQALFNISDDLPEEKIGMFDFGANSDLIGIIYQIFKRDNNKISNYEILKEAIPASKGLFGPIDLISLESPKDDKEKDSTKSVVPEDTIEALQNIGLEKIVSWKTKLLAQKNFIFIMYRWKEWDKEQKWKDFVIDIYANDETFLLFISKFTTEKRSQTFGDYGIKIKKSLNYKSLGDFTDLEMVKGNIEKMKYENNNLYLNNQQMIDSYLEGYESFLLQTQKSNLSNI